MEVIQTKFNVERKGDDIFVTFTRVDKISKEEFVAQFKGLSTRADEDENQIKILPEQTAKQLDALQKQRKNNMEILDTFRPVMETIIKEEQEKLSKKKRSRKERKNK